MAPISGRSVDVGRRIDIARRRRVGRGAEQLLRWALAGEQLPRLAEQHRTVAHTQARDARRLATTARVERHYACDPHQGVVAVAARHFEEGGSTAGGERWQRDFDEQLAGRERGLEHALEKLSRGDRALAGGALRPEPGLEGEHQDRKSTRLNSSHLVISYAVFCLKKKKQTTTPTVHTYHTYCITQTTD